MDLLESHGHSDRESCRIQIDVATRAPHRGCSWSRSTADVIEGGARRCSNLHMVQISDRVVLGAALWVIRYYLLVTNSDDSIHGQREINRPPNH